MTRYNPRALGTKYGSSYKTLDSFNSPKAPSPYAGFLDNISLVDLNPIKRDISKIKGDLDELRDDVERDIGQVKKLVAKEVESVKTAAEESAQKAVKDVADRAIGDITEKVKSGIAENQGIKNQIEKVVLDSCNQNIESIINKHEVKSKINDRVDEEVLALREAAKEILSIEIDKILESISSSIEKRLGGIYSGVWLKKQ
ncbi:hypothetical protein [Wolbachia endosymbiont of Ctenocephalides felis wCfeT]|uniref:hypothetical protein n=1 Tax=Wolbachia endosymbiont of Ctenocephalides felis wCfeT TaxID=2732593 RepID=UPI0014466CC8|nr:hypothetical protein [Wolbachia endosymbiont of Ctenocephalides felis wCfeT]